MNVCKAIKFFPGVMIQDIMRPDGPVDIMVGMEYTGFHLERAIDVSINVWNGLTGRHNDIKIERSQGVFNNIFH